MGFGSSDAEEGVVLADERCITCAEHLLRIYRTQKALVPFERQSSPLNAPRVAEVQYPSNHTSMSRLVDI